VVALVPVPVPVVGDPEGDGLVVALAQLSQQFRVHGLAPGPGVFGQAVGFAQDLDDVGRPGLQAAGAELRHGTAPADHVSCTLLDAREPGKHLLVGGVSVGDQEAGEELQDRGDGLGAPRPQRPQHRVLGVPGLDHGPQPGQQLTLLADRTGRIGLIGHTPHACFNLIRRFKHPAGVPCTPPRHWKPAKPFPNGGCPGRPAPRQPAAGDEFLPGTASTQ